MLADGNHQVAHRINPQHPLARLPFNGGYLDVITAYQIGSVGWRHLGEQQAQGGRHPHPRGKRRELDLRVINARRIRVLFLERLHIHQDGQVLAPGGKLFHEQSQGLFQVHRLLEILHVDGFFQQLFDRVGFSAALVVVGQAAGFVFFLPDFAQGFPGGQRGKVDARFIRERHMRLIDRQEDRQEAAFAAPFQVGALTQMVAGLHLIVRDLGGQGHRLPLQPRLRLQGGQAGQDVLPAFFLNPPSIHLRLEQVELGFGSLLKGLPLLFLIPVLLRLGQD